MSMESNQIDVIIQRYASEDMATIFSRQRRVELWRELWIALAEGEKKLGLPISKGQIDELKKFKSKINWKVAEKFEGELRHDVMAHVKAYGKQCPKAAGIIHLGSTSAYVTDNADLIMMKQGLELLEKKLVAVIDKLATFAEKEKETATVAFTHFQPAQPTTVGKRACLWAQNFVLDFERLIFELEHMRFHGVKGATGTQDSFLKLFDGDADKALALDDFVMEKMGFKQGFWVTGQTYPRKADTQVVTLLANICESAAKFANDMRLLQALHEIEEPMKSSQIGSSAMPYKQNPMRSERICSLARYVINLVGNCYDTAATQWFERTLDDSANRRVVLPQAFLICDAVLDLVLNITSGMKVNKGVIDNNLNQELPFLQTEEILMAAVKEGGDRQELHEVIRVHSKDAVKNVREKGESNDLLARLRDDPAFAKVPPKLLVRTDPIRLVGLSPQQVDMFIKKQVAPLRKKYKSSLNMKAKIRV